MGWKATVLGVGNKHHFRRRDQVFLGVRTADYQDVGVDVQSRQVAGGLVHAQDHGRLKVLRLDAVGDVSVGGGEGVADVGIGRNIYKGKGAVGIGEGSPGIYASRSRSEDVKNHLPVQRGAVRRPRG